jgi:peptidoglycan/LPS O-acetylase OafA/YrhL
MGSDGSHSFLVKLHGLRGIAVLYVVLFHFFKPIFPGGFAGVDLFFLLSGFLVTRSNLALITQTDLTVRSFLGEFYRRRVARIFPMLLFASFFSLFLGLIFTPANNLGKLLVYFTSSLVGLTNIKLFKDRSDYFSLDQDFNWFTQTWSLGVEEQFYLIFSIIIGITLYSSFVDKTKNLKKIFFILMVTSFLVTLAKLLKQDRPEAIFYLLHFRFWELCLGVCLSLMFQNYQVRFQFDRWENISLIFLVIGLFVPYDSVFFPFPNLLFICAGGVILILNCGKKTNTLAEKILSFKFLQYLGSISYSLYLIHWIILVLLKHSFGEDDITMGLGVLVSLAISDLTFRFVELPSGSLLRKSSNLSWALAIFLFVIAGVSYSLKKFHNFETNVLYIGRVSMSWS